MKRNTPFIVLARGMARQEGSCLPVLGVMITGQAGGLRLPASVVWYLNPGGVFGLGHPAGDWDI